MSETIHAQEWAQFDRYAEANEKIGPDTRGDRVVFMGNSITEGWSQFVPEFFEGKNYLNRGIGGQTTPQMLLRFKADVLDLDPAVVHILGGTNDIAENSGPMSLEMTMDHISAMAELARAHGVRVILCSVLPAEDYSWRPGLGPDVKIPELNTMIRDYAEANGFVYLDYFTAMVVENNAMDKRYTYDGVHPNKAGYEFMGPLAEKAIARALSTDVKELWKKEIIAVEKAFCDLAARKGIRHAFLTFAADDAVLMRNDKLTVGKEALRTYFGKATGSDTESLVWAPDFVDVSDAGDLAYTYGSYTYSSKDSAGQPVVRKGIFHTVWKRQPDGSWKFVWD
jgi:lysophospholipase L1-like esterase/ketosteroid isomerase-like protein